MLDLSRSPPERRQLKYISIICDSAQEAFIESISCWYWLVTTVCVSAQVCGIIMMVWYTYFKPPANPAVQSVDGNIVKIKKPIQEEFEDREAVIEKIVRIK